MQEFEETEETSHEVEFLDDALCDGLGEDRGCGGKGAGEGEEGGEVVQWERVGSCYEEDGLEEAEGAFESNWRNLAGRFEGLGAVKGKHT